MGTAGRADGVGMRLAPPRSALASGGRHRARALVLVLAVLITLLALPTGAAHAVSRTTLAHRLAAAADDYRASRTTWSGFVSADRVRWAAASSTAGGKLAAVRRALSAATTSSRVNALEPAVNRERTRASVFRRSTSLAGTSFSARRSAVSAGQNGFAGYLAGHLSPAAWAELRSDSAAVAALAAKDRRRAWASLGTTTSPSSSQAAPAVAALSSSTRATAPAGWVGVPGGCAVQAADASWLGAAAEPGRHLWVDDADVNRALERGRSGDTRATTAHRYLQRLADKLKTPITTDLAAVATPLQLRSQRLGYAALLGDDEAGEWLRRDLQSVLLPGPRTGNSLRDGVSLEALATDLDWTGLDESPSASAALLREAMLVRWVGPVSCRFDDLESTVTDTDNITLIVDTGLLHAAYALAPTEPRLAAALARTTLLRLVPAAAAMTSDGGSFEGPTYWNLQGRYLAALYGTTQAVYAGRTPPVTLPTATRSASYAWSSTTSTGASLAFADALVAPERLRPGLVAWVAHTTEDARAGALARAWLTAPTEGFQVLWYPTSGALASEAPARASTLFRRTGLAALQAGDTTAWLKAGSSGDSHAHLDLGSVGFSKHGVQWAVDPGQGDYSAAGYDSYAATSKRWTYWKVAAAGHSGLRGAGGQPPRRTAPFVSFRPSSDVGWASAGYVSADLRSVLPGASSATREVALSVAGDLRVADRVKSGTARTWTWSWVTEASVTVSGTGSRRSLTLVQDGHQVVIALSGLPAGSSVSVVAAPSGAVGPTGRALRAVTVTLGKTTFLAVNAQVS